MPSIPDGLLHTQNSFLNKEYQMRIAKIISVAAITVPISMNLNNKIKTTLKNKRNIYKNIVLINNSSLVD